MYEKDKLLPDARRMHGQNIIIIAQQNWDTVIGTNPQEYGQRVCPPQSGALRQYAVWMLIQYSGGTKSLACSKRSAGTAWLKPKT
ncbi:MAG: hypothetical protein WKG07_10645 [Hymenobacter sp.]